MKIRRGFVSNSSSSSFCIVGCMFPNYGDQEDYNSACKAMGIVYKKYLEEKSDDMNFVDYIYDKINSKGCRLTCSNCIENYSDENSVIGFNIEALNDDDKFIDFKQNICNHLNTCFELDFGNCFKLEDLKIYVDGGYNG